MLFPCSHAPFGIVKFVSCPRIGNCYCICSVYCYNYIVVCERIGPTYVVGHNIYMMAEGIVIFQ